MKEDLLFGIPNADVYFVMGILIFFILLEVIGGYWHRTQRNFGDWIQEAGGFLLLSLVTKPGIVLAVLYLGHHFFPETQNILAHNSLWLTLPIYLLVDDFLQYWYHRSAHEYDFLWKLHRAHHQAEEMGFFVSYRNAALYYLLMPNIWWVGIFSFLGGAKAVALGLILKQLIVIGSHSTVQWDKALYRYKMLHPLATLVERIFITPAFHYAHHGKTKRDGISDPNGNFGNMFSIWDQLFGTAHFTRQYPTELGLENDPKEHWTAPLLYPLVAANDPKSELSRGFKKTDTTRPEPSVVRLEKGQKYLWCQCGKSKNQPFCDSSHHGSKFKPLLFEAKKTGNVKLCNCKITKAGPFCDNSHVQLKK
ncbi:MAG: fatty acid hydroxylase [Bacteroidetes bacterium]|nr:MAG: fatty acid hydroxylase [Bacteroidota bacterium]